MVTANDIMIRMAFRFALHSVDCLDNLPIEQKRGTIYSTEYHQRTEHLLSIADAQVAVRLNIMHLCIKSSDVTDYVNYVFNMFRSIQCSNNKYLICVSYETKAIGFVNIESICHRLGC